MIKKGRHRKKQEHKTITITLQVWNEIRNTIGMYSAETGGVLGSSDGGNTIDRYYFDSTASTTGSTYTPDIKAVNRVIAEWNGEGSQFVGFIHSHPKGHTAPSLEDVNYAKQIMEVM